MFRKPEAMRISSVTENWTTSASVAGQLFESLVTRHLRVYAQPADGRVRHMRTWNDDREVDLIVEHADGIVAVEVKAAARVDPGTHAICAGSRTASAPESSTPPSSTPAPRPIEMMAASP